MSLQDLYNVTVDVIRITKTSDSMGGWTDTDVIHINDLPCRINWSKGFEKVQFNKDTHYRDAKLYCAVVDITTHDRIVYDSKTYEIVSVSNVDNMNRFLTIEMNLIE